MWDRTPSDRAAATNLVMPGRASNALRARRASLILAVLACALSCAAAPADADIPGFSQETNARLRQFFEQTRFAVGRKVAVFDGDGTTLGQVPHYLADECLFQLALRHPERKPQLIRQMQGLSNVSMPYVKLRVRYLAGLSRDEVRSMGEECFRRQYADKIYPPMRALLQRLQANGFETWIITASPEALYQSFLSREYAMPITQVVGVRSVVEDGVLSEQIIEPTPQDHGKRQAIESFVQEQPLFAAGNSRGDKEMIEYSRGMRMIINPDEFTAPDQTESIASYARRNDWLIEKIVDQNPAGIPFVSAERFGTRVNQSHPAAN